MLAYWPQKGRRRVSARLKRETVVWDGAFDRALNRRAP